jgi:predicted nucleotidyltransferase
VVKLAFLKITVEESGPFIPPEDSITMRLSQVEFNALRTILGELDPAGRIYLYGSRADDNRRGGDIDVYLQASRAIDLKTRLRVQYRLQQACDTDVDLLVKSPQQATQAIHQIAIEQGILL